MRAPADCCHSQAMTHPQLVVSVVGVRGNKEVELDVVPLVRKDTVLKLRACTCVWRGKGWAMHAESVKMQDGMLECESNLALYA